MNIALRLDSLIRRSGMTRIALARQLGVSPSTVTAWCAGTTDPPLGRLDAIADALGVAPADLIAPDTPDIPAGLSRCPMVAANAPDAVVGYMLIPSAWRAPSCVAVCAPDGLWLCERIHDAPDAGLMAVLYRADGRLCRGYALYDAGRWTVTDEKGAITAVSAPEYRILRAMCRVSPPVGC